MEPKLIYEAINNCDYEIEKFQARLKELLAYTQNSEEGLAIYQYVQKALEDIVGVLQRYKKE